MSLTDGRLVCWGATHSLDSLRHIYRSFHETARKIGVPTIWVPDEAQSRAYLRPGDVVFVTNVWGHNIGEAIDGVDYVTHNFDGSHPLHVTADDRHHLRLQVFTNDSFGELWDPVRLFYREGHCLFQPWGTNLLAEEFYDPVFNAGSREAVFVGAVWDDNGLGNVHAIEQLRVELGRRGLQWKHLTQVTDQVMLQEVRAARLAPAITGRWQVEHNYLPCRVFKNVSYGQLAVTNVPKFRELFGDAFVGGDTAEEMLDAALRLRRGEWDELVRAQQRVVARYSYRESIGAIHRALEEIR